MAEAPRILLEHHLKRLKLPTILQEYEKLVPEALLARIERAGPAALDEHELFGLLGVEVVGLFAPAQSEGLTRMSTTCSPQQRVARRTSCSFPRRFPPPL